MENKGVAFAWGGWAVQLVTVHYSLVLSTLVGVFAIWASIEAAKANRAKRRHMDAHDEAVCRACGLGKNVECPYPYEDRPENCAKRFEG